MGEAVTAGRTGFLKLLVFMMFAMFAMTTDSVGTVIPRIIEEFGLGLTAAGSFHYATMSGIGIAAIMLGFLADRFGRKPAIVIGLALFGVSSLLVASGNRFGLFVAMLFFSGLGIGIFKSGALALIGDLSCSTRDHAATMNLVEGFFGVGAIVGPGIVTYLLTTGAGWKGIYVIAGVLCGLLLLAAIFTPFPPRKAGAAAEAVGMREAFQLLRDPAALFFSAALMFYVGAEAAIYVWAPTFFMGYNGPGAVLAAYVVSIFFVLRAGGRFVGAWLLRRFDWSTTLLVSTLAMTALFWAALLGGRPVAVFALPATGLFMSVLYPTLNSTGISCFDRRKHGAAAGLLLFFTCVGAVVAPFAMAAVSDALADTSYSLAVGALFASALAAMCVWNWVRRPMAQRLSARDRDDYAAA